MSITTYSVTNAVATGAPITHINLNAGTTRLIRLLRAILGCGAAAADAVGVFSIRRSTDAGSGGTDISANVGKSNPLGPNSAIAANITGATYSGAAPAAAGANLAQIPLHQRVLAFWVPVRAGSEIYSVLTANNGICLRGESYSAGTPVVHSTMEWEE